MYQPANKTTQTLMNRVNGKRLAKQARDRGEYELAWKHAQAYNLGWIELNELKLPEKYRPRGFNPPFPKAMGCVG